MNAAHRHTLDNMTSPMCECGEGEEDLLHMMWRCPLNVQQKPWDLQWWADQPPAQSMSLILPSHASASYIADWRRVCQWALTVLQRRHRADPDLECPMAHPQNGHWVIVRQDLGYVWCAKCFVARKAKEGKG